MYCGCLALIQLYTSTMVFISLCYNGVDFQVQAIAFVSHSSMSSSAGETVSVMVVADSLVEMGGKQ